MYVIFEEQYFKHGCRTKNYGIERRSDFKWTIDEQEYDEWRSYNVIFCKRGISGKCANTAHKHVAIWKMVLLNKSKK